MRKVLAQAVCEIFRNPPTAALRSRELYPRSGGGYPSTMLGSLSSPRHAGLPFASASDSSSWFSAMRSTWFAKNLYGNKIMIRNSHKGKFIVIDGIDGTGKATQVELLQKRLKDEGFEVRVADFPRYKEKSAGPVELYLKGLLGSAEDVGPYRASVLYAVDRYCAVPGLEQWLENGVLVLSNRYVAANLGHQGGKIRDPEERSRFWEWALQFEHEFFGIPRPDHNYILHAPPKIAHRLVGSKGERAYLGGKRRDIHEEDIGHLKASSEAYLALASAYPDQFEVIDCAPAGEMLSREQIAELLWGRVALLLRV